MNPSPKSADVGEQTIFDAARQIPDTSARAAYLDAVCTGDASLRQRVEKLLNANQRADEFLAQNPLGALTASLAPADGEGETGRGLEAPGTIIGHYKLLEKLGEGGFGVVYMAEQKQPIKRRVALKIIKVGMDTREVVARFEAERQALAVMDHPNIAKVFDAGATDAPLTGSAGILPASRETEQPAGKMPALPVPAGRPYFVMELIRGIKITDYCDEKHLSARERLDLFTQVCQAVQHAHQKGIIHRDLKPSNILVTVNDGVAVPKIIDFGIAKATQMELTEKTVFTRFHQFLGTPAYMSLTSVDIDTRSDIYSLGVLLYELLTGKTPFDTNELLKAGLDEMRRTIREVEPLKPSTRLVHELTTASARRSLKGRTGEKEKGGNKPPAPESPLLPFPSAPFPPRQSADQPQDDEISLPRLNQLKQLIPALRGDLDWIVMKCLEKDRARRYETANGLASDIQRHLNNEPVVACPPSNLYRFQKMVRRNKLAFAAGAGIAAALVIGSAIALWQSVEKTRAYNRAVAAERFLKDMLEGAGPDVARGRDVTLLKEILGRTAQRLDTDLKDQPEVQADLRETIGQVYNAIGQYAEAEAMTRQALSIRRRVLGPDHITVASSLNSLGERLYAHGELPEAEAVLREALQSRRKLLRKDHPDVAASLSLLGIVLSEQGKLTESEALHREALATRRKIFGEEHIDVAFSLNNLANTLVAEHKFEEAEEMYRKALKLRIKLVGNESAPAAATRWNLGRLLGNLGKLEEAESLLQESVATYDKILGEQHSATIKLLPVLARLLEVQGKDNEARVVYQEILKRSHNLVDQSDARVLDIFAWLMATALDPEFRDGPGAVALAEQAVGITRRKRPQYLRTLAAAYAEAGGFEKAIATQKEAMSLVEDESQRADLMSGLQLYESSSPYREEPVAISQNRIAWSLATAASPKLRDGVRAIAFAEKAVAATNRKDPGILDTLAAAYAEAGEFAKAVRVQEEAIAHLKDEKLKQELVSRLKLYESNQPYRER